MIEEPFAHGSTLFHKRDSRVKLIAAGALSLILALTDSFAVAGVGCLLMGLLLWASRPEPKILCRRILTVNFFTFFLWLTLPLTYGGNESIHFLSLHLSLGGIKTATLISLKTNAIFFCFLTLLATSPLANLGHGMEKLGMPRKFTFLLLFSYRQLFIIHQEYQRLQRAARLRGFIPANSIHTYRTYGYLFGMTLVKSWNRAERIHQAMILRGFTGSLIPLNQPPLNTKDRFFLALMLLLCLFLLSISFYKCPYAA